MIKSFYILAMLLLLTGCGPMGVVPLAVIVDNQWRNFR
jgi:predicted small lipoprotein YifL